MMILDQNRQIVTKHISRYVAKLFDSFWTRRAFFGPEIYFGMGAKCYNN